jgi:hypothetical protein
MELQASPAEAASAQRRLPRTDGAMGVPMATAPVSVANSPADHRGSAWAPEDGPATMPEAMRNVQSNKGMALFLEVLLMWSRRSKHQLAQESSHSDRARDRVPPTDACVSMHRTLAAARRTRIRRSDRLADVLARVLAGPRACASRHASTRASGKKWFR